MIFTKRVKVKLHGNDSNKDDTENRTNARMYLKVIRHSSNPVTSVRLFLLLSHLCFIHSFLLRKFPDIKKS